MAHVTEFRITIKGRGGHASQPHAAIDPVICGAHLITALQTIVSRNMFYQDSVVLSVTNLKAGEAFNVIPDTATLCGTTRDLCPKAFARLKERMITIVTEGCKMFECEGTIDFTDLYPVLVNTPEETKHVERVAKTVFEKVSTDQLPMLGAEDFAYFTQKKPGCFFFVGTKEEKHASGGCHATSFNFNDAAIPYAVKFWVRLVEDRLKTKLF